MIWSSLVIEFSVLLNFNYHINMKTAEF